MLPTKGLRSRGAVVARTYSTASNHTWNALCHVSATRSKEKPMLEDAVETDVSNSKQLYSLHKVTFCPS
jgi:hypothetical protein